MGTAFLINKNHHWAGVRVPGFLSTLGCATAGFMALVES